MTAEAGQWSGTPYTYHISRVIREYTDDAIKSKYASLDATAIEELLKLPSLFAYEEQAESDARIGWLTRIRTRDDEVRIEYEIERDLPPIPSSAFKTFDWDLDIGSWEMNRTHWAVKNVELLPVLMEGGVLMMDSIQGLPGDSKVVRLGLEKPVTEIPVSPTVFRVPRGDIDPTLLSVMMPFDLAFDPVFQALLTACESTNLICKRADDIWEESEIIQDVFSLLYRSRVVICDFSGRNANVFYEAGIAHTLGRPVIPILQHDSDVPFDLHHHRFIKYLNNDEGRQKLTEQVSRRLQTLLRK